MEQQGRRLNDGCIVFNGMKSVFYSGQVMEGKVNFELSSPINMSAIDVVFLGEANVQWIEEQLEVYNGVSRQKFLKYLGREEYFKQIQRLAQGPSELAAGPHSIPFSYQLPFSCPSSFKGEKGQVTYSVTVSVIHQDGVTKDEIQTEFEVIDPLNLNTGSDDIKKPLVMEFEEEMSCQCFWVSKPLGVMVRLPAQGVTPGAVVPVSVAVRNATSVEINKIIFQLTTRQRYRSQQPSSEYEPPEAVLTSLAKGPILSNTLKDYVFELTVPDLLPPNLEQCSLIDVGYFFKVMIKLSGCNEDMEDEAEICIGLVPLGENLDYKCPHLADKLPNGPIPVPPKVPPSYQSVVNDQMQFQPSAPVLYSSETVHTPNGSSSNTVRQVEIGFKVPGDNSTSMHISSTQFRSSTIILKQ